MGNKSQNKELREKNKHSKKAEITWKKRIKFFQKVITIILQKNKKTSKNEYI